MTVKQIHFRSWGTGPKNYWHDVSSMAMFVAASLQYPLPRCNGLASRVSTIRVEQYKEKFGDVRIYCILAHPDEVKARWQEEGHKSPDPTLDFTRRCLLSDARHYRNCYMSMVGLVPHLRDALCCAADYGVLLYEDAAAIESEIMPHVEKHEQLYLSRFYADSIEQLRVIFDKVYGVRRMSP